MTLGVVMLVHTAFDRAEETIRHWVAGGCPVVVHVDKSVSSRTYQSFVSAFADVDTVAFCKRFRCKWGTWGLVAASQAASELLLERHPDINHVYLASGACLPLRPVSELRSYLSARPDVDFIESATTADVPWTIGGLDIERFTLRFPFSWKQRRRLFDRYVKLQRLVGFQRNIPDGIVPHMGSQWWCLTRATLSAILEDPERPVYDRYFRKVWIPDESYYQTLARIHSKKIESRSLTLAKFDYQGKPHIFYDDHVELLKRSDCFVARKIWKHADLLYRTFPKEADPTHPEKEPNTSTIDRIFTRAVQRRTRGRAGLYMQSRYPNMAEEHGITAVPYTVLQGLSDVFPDFANWLTRRTGAPVHGHLFAQDGAEFVGDEAVFRGGLSDSPQLRDYNAPMFLTNLIWNGRDQHHCFYLGPKDSQKIVPTLSSDANANIWVVSGAWAIPLFLSGVPADEIRAEAAKLQRVEHKLLKALRSSDARARIRIYTLVEFLEAPMDILQMIIDEIAGHRGTALAEVPKMVDLAGFGAFLQDLKNQGMHPFLVGEFPAENVASIRSIKPPKPYVVGQK